MRFFSTRGKIHDCQKKFPSRFEKLDETRDFHLFPAARDMYKSRRNNFMTILSENRKKQPALEQLKTHKKITFQLCVCEWRVERTKIERRKKKGKTRLRLEEEARLGLMHIISLSSIPFVCSSLVLLISMMMTSHRFRVN